METIRELYRIGHGPSSSHTMAPRKAAEQFRDRNQQAASFRATLYGSLAATGRGHLTDRVIEDAFAPIPVEFIWQPSIILPFHPNGLDLEALDKNGSVLSSWRVYSTGGGKLVEDEKTDESKMIYPLGTMKEILSYCSRNGKTFWEFVEECEGGDIWDYLHQINQTMHEVIERGIHAEGVLPGSLGLARRAWTIYRKIHLSGQNLVKEGFLPAYALAVSEENAAGNIVVTAPTCGSAGVLPAIIKHIEDTIETSEIHTLRALATAGLIGNLIKHQASISGAEVGCQGEVGAACSMAAAAATQLLGGSIRQIEYAAEIGLEHHLGLTCDPVDGMVQIPCIERNVFCSDTRA